MVSKISIEEVQYISYELCKKFFDWNEPIPPFTTRSPGILESCLEQPFQTFDKLDLYPTLINKAAILFYCLIKNHPFQNGNKRMAVMTLIVFLYENGLEISISNEDLVEIARMIAGSSLNSRKMILQKIERFLNLFTSEIE